MAEKYEVVCTNPPYMGGSGMDKDLSNYVKKNYPDSKADLFAVFIEKCLQLTKQNCYTSMVTMQSWMFLSSFEKMRVKAITQHTITNLMHMENMVMGIAFGTAVTVFKNSVIPHYKGTYNFVKLKDIENSKPKVFPNYENRFAQVSTENFSKIPGSPIAYWAGKQIFEAFSKGQPLSDFALARNGMKTGDNGQFLRLWWEVDNYKTNMKTRSCSEAKRCKEKWFPYNKGGEYRKWYGNNDYVVNWENCGYRIFNCAKADKRNVQDYPAELKFAPSLSWSLVTSGKPAFRYKEHNLSDIAGMSLFSIRENIVRYLGLLNSDVALEVLRLIAPTINFQAGDIARIPIMDEVNNNSEIIPLVEKNIELSKKDWDSFETSWDFKRHPMLPVYADAPDYAYLISNFYEGWVSRCDERFNRLKANEEELNRIFIDIYGLVDELTPEVEDKDVTVRKADLQRDIKSLISYAVGCMFGRYSLDTEGLAYAGGEWNSEKYKSFIPDEDNCIPITDTAYFEDDIVGRFCEFVKVVYGEDTLEANLEFIAKALGNKGNTSRDIIRNYFLNDFFKDHCKIYQKRPIYWLFDSGKQNGFKALCYMHRWNADTIGNMRVEYLHRIQRTYEKEIEREQDTIDNTTNNRERAAATKRKEKLQKQLKEAKDYDAKVAHLALSRPDIDLDDGVKVNYEKVQTAQDGKKLQILAKI